MDRPDARTPRHVCAAVLLVAVLLLGAWFAVHAAGGTRTALPHLFYLPVVAAALTLGVRAAVVTGLLATVLCGPLMPLDTATGVAQGTGNWVARGAFLVVVGVLTGVGVRETSRRHDADIEVRLRNALDGQPPLHVVDLTGPDADTVADVLRERTFGTVFQPIVDLRSDRPRTYEALTRFDGTWGPDRWFAAAAEHGLGLELELATMHAALDASQELPAGVGIALNASPCLLLDDRLQQLLTGYLQLRPVTVEVTEHAVVQDYDVLAVATARLRRLGVRIAVDDAGAGFASMQHVLRLAPDEVKLDPSLTVGVRDDPVRRALAVALVRFAHDTGIELVAEGIETPEDLDAWRVLGADAAQGYLLGRPRHVRDLDDDTAAPHVAARHHRGR